MPKTYGTVTTFTAGSVLTAAQLNVASTAVNNLVVPPACRVYNSANINPYTNGAAITWNTESYDTDDMHSTSTNTDRITFQTPGIYQVTLQIRATWSGTLTAQSANILLDGNTSTYWAVQEVFGVSTTVGGSWISVTGVSSFVAGQYVQGTFSVTGATSPIVATPSFFAATWVGRTV